MHFSKTEVQALPGKTGSQVKKTNKKPNNKQYETALFQNENVQNNSEEGKGFLLF